MLRLPLYLLLLLLPLAVAGHNIGTGVVLLILLAQLCFLGLARSGRDVWRTFKVPLALTSAYIVILAVASWVNPQNPVGLGGSFIWGHLIWAFLPAVICLAQPKLEPQEWWRLFICLAGVTAFMGMVSASQAIWGWRLVGTTFVAGPTRAQGFYSHPLTLAYVGLLLFPVGCAAVARWPMRLAPWLQLVGAGLIVYASQSRTVQVVCLLALLATVLHLARGRLRWALLGMAVLVGAVLLLTDNPVATRFKETLSSQGHDVRSDYPDDRLAFWHAHTLMLQERPLLGHGDDLGKAYRAPYYERLGLGDFERQYEAHNMYLQVAVNTGLIGLGVFLSWLAWHFLWARRQLHSQFGRSTAILTLATFCLASLTQNSFQDAEVRFALTLFCAGLWLGGLASRADTSASPRVDTAS